MIVTKQCRDYKVLPGLAAPWYLFRNKSIRARADTAKHDGEGEQTQWHAAAEHRTAPRQRAHACTTDRERHGEQRRERARSRTSGAAGSSATDTTTLRVGKDGGWDAHAAHSPSHMIYHPLVQVN